MTHIFEGDLYDRHDRIIRRRYQWHYSTTPTLAAVKAVLRAGPYAWPGGYPLFLLTGDCEALSFDAARECWREIVAEAITGGDPAWQIIGCKVNWEDPALFCCHSGARIPSAYAEDDAEGGES